MRRELILNLAILLAVAGPGQSQTPGAAIQEGLEILTGGGGGCESVAQEPTAISFFPNVQFIRGICTAEHGNPISGIVALDSDSVLYLFDSPTAFNFLASRHPPIDIGDSSLPRYVRTALELSDQTTHQHVLVLDWPTKLEHCELDLPAQAFWTREMDEVGWDVVAHTIYPAYDGTEIHRHRLVVWTTGQVTIFGSDLVCAANRLRPPNQR